MTDCTCEVATCYVADVGGATIRCYFAVAIYYASYVRPGTSDASASPSYDAKAGSSSL